VTTPPPIPIRGQGGRLRALDGETLRHARRMRMDGATVRQIAAVLEVSAGTVSRALRRP
jgi:hypothetical protein